MTNDDIFDAVEKRKKELALYANVTNETVIGSAARSVFASIEDAFDDEGHFDLLPEFMRFSRNNQ